MRILFIIYLICFGLVSALGQNSGREFPFTKQSRLRQRFWTIEEGLPSQGLRYIFQSKDGYLWLSSYEGLIRYDGFEFKLFNSVNTPVFKNNICEKIVEDQNGRLWISTRGGLIYYENNTFEAYNFADSLGTISRILFIDSKNRLWLNSENYGMFYYLNGKIHLFDNKKFSGKGLWSITEDPKGNIYFGTFNKTIVKYNGLNFKIYFNTDTLNNDFFLFLHYFNNQIWWINEFNGLHSFDGEKARKFNLRSEPVYSARTDRFGNRWISTNKGVYRQKSNDSLQLIISTPDLIADQTLLDYEGNLWFIVYRRGLMKVSTGKFDIFNEANGLHGKICNTVCEQDSSSFLAAYENGIIDKISGSQVNIFKKIKGYRIRHLMKDSQGNLWVSTYSGLIEIDKNGKQIRYDMNNGLPTNHIRLTYEDSKHNIWVATRNSGIFMIDRNRHIKTFPEFNILYATQILSINENIQHEIIISTAGKGCFFIRNGKLYKPENEKQTGIVSVFNTYIEPDGTIWLISNGNGIFRYKNGKYTAFNYRNGLANDSPFDLIEDNYGNFWIPYNRGIMKLNKNQLNDYAEGKISSYTCELYADNHSIDQMVFTPAAKSVKTSNGKILIPSLNGFLIIDPGNIFKNTIPPTVHIEQFTVDNKPMDTKHKVIVPAGKRNYTFKYTAINFRNPEKVRFRYKLEGFDKEWKETDYRIRDVSYTNLNYGDYIFKVKACNEDGVWNLKAEELSFKIEAFYYQTVWFKIIMILLFLMLVIFIYKIRLAKIQKDREKLKKLVDERTEMIQQQKHEIEKQNEEILLINNTLLEQKQELEKHKKHLEELVKERTRELEKAKIKAEESDRLKTAFLNNISHEIRTPLNGILGFGQILKMEGIDSIDFPKYLDIIFKSAAQLQSIVEQIIYISKIQAGIETVSINKVDIKKLITDVIGVYREVAKIKNLELKTDFPDDQIIINTDYSKLEQIVATLLDNAIKFTHEGYVRIAYKKQDNFIKFSVEDTGIGIEQHAQKIVFEKFNQLNYSESGKYGGLGLGLPISKAYVELLGGKIWYESSEGKGSVFYFTIPVK